MGTSGWRMCLWMGAGIEHWFSGLAVTLRGLLKMSRDIFVWRIRADMLLTLIEYNPMIHRITQPTANTYSAQSVHSMLRHPDVQV